MYLVNTVESIFLNQYSFNNIYIKRIAILNMVKRCAICDEDISEEHGKLSGTMLKIRDLESKKDLVFVCSDCQKTDKWIERAKVRAA